MACFSRNKSDDDPKSISQFLWVISGHCILSLFIAAQSELDPIGFVGVYCSLFLVMWIGNKAITALYDTYIGVLLGHNVNLRQLGEWAVITGATDGIGLEYARQLAEKGLNIVLISRSLDRLTSCADQISKQYGVETKIIQVDFSISGELYEERVQKSLDGMDIGVLINNVGMTYSSPEYFHIVTTSSDFIHKMVNLNVISASVMTRIVLPQMLDKGKGAIVNVGSFVSLLGAPFFSLYSASKSFLETLTIDLSREYGEKGIFFQYQSPGYVTTKIAKIKTPSLFVPTPEQYVKVALNSIGLQQKSSIWVPQRLLVFGLELVQFIFPRVYDKDVSLVIKTFWLFAKKRQMHKAMGYNNNLNV